METTIVQYAIRASSNLFIYGDSFDGVDHPCDPNSSLNCVTNAQRRLQFHVLAGLHVKVRDQDIVVAMPAPSLRVVYRKQRHGSQLTAGLDYFQSQQKRPITRAEFTARALKLANEMARELS
jgi:hypothetical protein